MSYTILIVDDSLMIRQMLREALEADGYSIIEAGNGREATVLLERLYPELIITDINMPEMDGLSLIRWIRENGGHNLTPILVLTTESSRGMMQRGREAGATGWLVKPFNTQQLRETTRCALELREKVVSRTGSTCG
jgi:two-component system chemotaxis response regulator CheY